MIRLFVPPFSHNLNSFPLQRSVLYHQSVANTELKTFCSCSNVVLIREVLLVLGQIVVAGASFVCAQETSSG
jgi:hypothetical protein